MDTFLFNMGRPFIFLSLVIFVVVLTSAQKTRGSRKPGGGKIVGGSTTTIEQHPWQVSFQKWGQHFCGGSIITAYHILTAAHCFKSNKDDKNTDVLVGSTMSNSGGTRHAISSVLRHPEYNPRSKENDIAIVRLRQAIKRVTGTMTIPLGEKLPADGSVVTASGWGLITENGPASRDLRSVQMRKVSREECSKSYGSLPGSMFCAGMPNGGKDACQGDSGGPLVCDGVQVGIVSWGLGCARPGYPGVYTSVPHQMRWIKENTGRP